VSGPRLAGATPGERPRIPGYEIESELGRGSTGVVYRARQTSVDRLVALKVMHLDMASNARSIKRLQREARIAAHLSHPNLIAAIDMGRTGATWWFAMELVEGPSLAERLEKGGRLREEDALRLFIQLCDALQHASEKGVVHRDIKPANILLERPDHPRLADLGLARIEDDPMLTRTGSTLGTPHYVSPEQARDPALADVRSDIWSLGATLYHAVCGRPPFAGSSTAEILSSVLYSPIPDPLELRPELSRGLGLVLRKCLSRDPGRRYFSPAELMEDLERVAAHKAPQIRRGSLEPLDPTRGERRGLAVGAALVGAAGALLALVLWSPWSEPEVVPGQEPGVTDARWLPLERFERQLAGGRLVLAAAFAELEELRAGVPPGQRAALESLAERLRQDLRAELAAHWARASADFDARLGARDFPGARELVEVELAERLIARTGFAPEELPQKLDRGSLERRRAGLARSLRERREAALSAAAATVASHARHSLLPEVDRTRRAGRWNEARELLAASDADLLAAAGADARGLGVEELAQALAPVREQLAARSRELEAAWQRLDGELLPVEIERLSARAAERLRANGDPGALEDFELGIDRLLAQHGIDRELLAGSPQRKSLELLASRRRELRDLADESAQSAGRARLAELEERARPFYARRDYAGALGLWRASREEPALTVVRDTVEVRLEGAQELVAFLRRAADAVQALDGESYALRQGSITVPGVIRAEADPLEEGFRLGETGGSPLLYRLVPDPDAEGALLDAPALEGFAIHGADLQGDIGLQLQRALFRYHEGDYTGAQELLASDALQGGALIYYDLGLRVARELGAEQDVRAMRVSRAEEELARLTGSDAQAMDPERRSFEIRRLLREYRDVLSDRAQQILLQTRRALESKLPPATLEDFRRAFGPSEVEFPGFGRVALMFRFDAPRVGSWERGDWFPTADGWSSRRRADLAELVEMPGPALALVDPLRLDGAALEVELELTQPEDSPPELLAVSVLGFHAVFVGPLGSRPARFLSDTTSLDDVARRAREGEGQRFDGFEAGGTHRLGLRLSPGSGRLQASADGRAIDSSIHRPPTLEPGSARLELRAIEPVVLRELHLRGDRR